MSQLEMVAYITEENKRRKRKRILLTKKYFEMSCLALAYLSMQRAPRDLGCFNDDEEKVAYRKYILKKTYDGSETACYDTLVEHHNNGDHAQNGWKPHVYNACIKNVKETCNVDITKDKILGRIKTFDKHYEIISKMLAQSGFGWDSENNMVEVDSDEVWSHYVEANKDASSYRNKVVMNWQAIQTIYSQDHATGVGARTAAESVQEEETIVLEESPDLPPKRQRTGEAILCMMGQMKTSFDDALKTTEPLPMPKVTPPTEILDALKKLEMENCDMLRAYGKLVVNERLFEALTALPDELKKPWLLTLP